MYRKLKLFVVCGVLTVVAFSGLDNQAHGQDRSHRVDPKVFGKTIGEWSAEWMQWALSIPADQNPILDQTGAFCDVGQPGGKVWFLAGRTIEGVVERTCTIPKGKALFFLLANAFWFDCPGTPDEDLSDDEIRAILAEFVDLACQLTCTVDGVAVSALRYPAVRTQSPEFTVTLPEGSILDGICPDPGLPVGTPHGRMFSDGYWVMVPPLAPGDHVIELHGAFCDPNTNAVFEAGVTYHLTVLKDDDDDDD